MEENRDLLDQIGLYVGYIRQYTSVALNDLAYGVCTPAYLLRVEAGERGMNEVSSDTLLQRLGQPIENFLCILDEKDYFFLAVQIKLHLFYYP